MSDTVSIWDYAEQEQQITVAAFFGLILRYGMHCQQLFALYAP
jgi:hypothetical protein